MIRSHLWRRGALSVVTIRTGRSMCVGERGLTTKAKRNPPGRPGVRPGARPVKESKAPRIQRPPKLSIEASAAILPQANVPVPPAYLSATGSANVYVATCATEEFQINPQSLFVEKTTPPSFRRAQFHYISPKLFHHELPKHNIPEVAVLGRSNVGKSSLLNAVMRKQLARASKQPGRTQTVHYFGLMPNSRRSNTNPDIDNVSAALGFVIDLPGYGFAKAPDKNVSEWQELTQTFLLARRDKGTLTRTFILVDSRRGTSQFDRNIMGWFDEAEIPYSVVLTKADRVSLPQIVRFSNEVCMRYHSQLYQGNGSQGPIVHVTSASRNRGIEELMASIDAEFAGFHEGGRDRDALDQDIAEDDDDDRREESAHDRFDDDDQYDEESDDDDDGDGDGDGDDIVHVPMEGGSTTEKC